MLKSDYANAFEAINHSAMLKIMKQIGFNENWLKWIEIIFGSGMSVLLLNGIPGRQFHRKRGVRKGDPFSPVIKKIGC